MSQNVQTILKVAALQYDMYRNEEEVVVPLPPVPLLSSSAIHFLA
jgi:hypothetical protein